MFSFLKQKIKDAVSVIAKKFEKEGTVEKESIIEREDTEQPKKNVVASEKGAETIAPVQNRIQPIQPLPTESSPEKAPIQLPQSLPKPISAVQKDERKQKEERNPVPVEIIQSIVQREEKPQKKYAEEEATGFLGKLTQKITTTKISKEEFEELFWELEVSLLENNVAFEVIEIIKLKLQKILVDKPLRRGQVEKLVETALMEAVDEAMSFAQVDFLKTVQSKRPYVICFVGINGSGKTTTIAKVAHYLKKNKISCVMAAGDTFRAAAIQQLEEHAARIKVKLIKQDYGSDAAAVAYDAISYAKAHDIDVVLIDTAGRMQSNVNLMDEMKKIIRVAKPDMTLFIGESITGNDCIEQARQFNDAVGITGIVLAKADVDEKGGAALSIAYVTGKPIVFLGMGQKYDDLKLFSKEIILENLGLKA